MFIPHDSIVLSSLVDYLGAHPELKFERVVEIGCGGGQLLNHLSERFPEIEPLTGLDLGADQIEDNKEAYASNQRAPIPRRQRRGMDSSKHRPPHPLRH